MSQIKLKNMVMLDARHLYLRHRYNAQDKIKPKLATKKIGPFKIEERFRRNWLCSLYLGPSASCTRSSTSTCYSISSHVHQDLMVDPYRRQYLWCWRMKLEISFTSLRRLKKSYAQQTVRMTCQGA